MPPGGDYVGIRPGVTPDRGQLDIIAAELPRTFKIRERQEFERFLSTHVAQLMLYPIVEVGHTNPEHWLHMNRALRQAELAGERFDAAAYIFDPMGQASERDAVMFRTAIYAGTIAVAFLVVAVVWSWLLRREVRRQTRELAESKERYELAVNGVNEGVWDWNILTDDDYLSPRWKALLGFRDDELENVASTFFDSLHPEDRPRVIDVLDAHLNCGSPYSVEIRMLHKDGEYRWFLARGEAQRDTTGRPVRMLGSIADITERKEAERALYEAQHLLSTILATTGLGFWFFDTEAVTTDVNPGMCGILGRSREEILGKGVYAFVDDDNAAIFRRVIENRNRGIYEPYEISLSRPDGTRIPCISTPLPLFDQNGKRTGLVGIWTEISERVAVGEELRRSLAEKETLLREIHHRVKNNLQIISSLLYFQARKLKDPDDVSAIEEGRDRLRAMMLVHEKLYLSDDLSQVDFGGYVRTLIQQLAESHAPHGGLIAVRAEADVRTLPIELATPYGLLVSELVTNALKHAFPDGRAGEVVVRIGDEDGRMKVTVADDGVGLPEGFDPRTGGSFGWQLIEGLLSQVDGDLALECNAGTMVTVLIPYPKIVQ